MSHRWLGPLIAGCLSIAGAAAADRVRRSVFEHEREVEASAEHLRQEVEVDEALARVGQELIALPDTRRILDALCRLTTEVLACDASHTYLWDAERQEYSAAAGYGDTPEQWEALRLVRYPQAPGARIPGAHRQPSTSSSSSSTRARCGRRRCCASSTPAWSCAWRCAAATS